jgi:hypothetical protein
MPSYSLNGMNINLLLAAGPQGGADSCLFLSKDRLQRVFCPFQVVCVEPVRQVTPGDYKRVDKVLGWGYWTLLYFIEGKLYPHHFFRFQPPCLFTNVVIEY